MWYHGGERRRSVDRCRARLPVTIAPTLGSLQGAVVALWPTRHSGDALELLIEPGTFYIDRVALTISYVPRPGEVLSDPSTGVRITVDTMIDVRLLGA